MHGKWIAVVCLGLILTIINYSTAQQAKEITCTGKVADTAGEPIAGAKIGLYKLKVTIETMSYDVDLVQELSTQDNGTFTVKTQADDNELSGQTVILVQKDNIGPGESIGRHGC